MSTGDTFLVLSAFLASGVEFVEALTIVLAAGLARGWRSSVAGLGAATLVLAVVVAVLGPALTVIPIQALRLVVGALLLVFGLQWLRKAILRASGYKALHDEDAIFARELAEAEGAAHVERAGVDWYGFTLAFKGVLLEGLEVVFIVLTFGSAQGSIPLAAAGAACALVLVAGVGVAVRAPLARAPENAMKFAVGVMLTTFGIFWSVEGAGADWPGSDAALLGVLGFVALFSFALVRLLRRERLEAVPRDGADLAAVRPLLVGLRDRRRLARRGARGGRDRRDRRPRGGERRGVVAAAARRPGRAVALAAPGDTLGLAYAGP